MASAVTNFGETGYVSTQNLIALMLELRAGRRPDVVVSMTASTTRTPRTRSSVPDCPTTNRNRVAEFNLSTAPVTRQGRVFVGEMSRRLAVLDLTKRVLRRVGLGDPLRRRLAPIR